MDGLTRLLNSKVEEDDILRILSESLENLKNEKVESLELVEKLYTLYTNTSNKFAKHLLSQILAHMFSTDNSSNLSQNCHYEVLFRIAKKITLFVKEKPSLQNKYVSILESICLAINQDTKVENIALNLQTCTLIVGITRSTFVHATVLKLTDQVLSNSFHNHLVWRHFSKLLLKVSKNANGAAQSEFCLQTSEILVQRFLHDFTVVLSNFVSTNVIDGKHCIDDTCARQLMLFGIKCAVQLQTYENAAKSLSPYLLLCSESSLVETFSESDGELIDMLSSLFQIASREPKEGRFFNNTMSIGSHPIDPFMLFRQLLASIRYDESVLLDWLISCKAEKFISYLCDVLCLAEARYCEFENCFHQAFEKNKSDGSKQVLFPENYIENKNIPSTVDLGHNKVNLDSQFNVYIQDSVEPSELVSKHCEQLSLVDYSSSENEENEDDGIEIFESTHSKITEQKEGAGIYSSDESDIAHSSSELDCVQSCLIRLQLKLERIGEKNLVDDKLSDVLKLISNLEDKFT